MLVLGIATLNCAIVLHSPTTERSYWQLRAHMFMARNLIGSDETGLSDAFARIILNDHVVTTCVINETLSPKWDQTLIVEKMTFYFNENTIKEGPPVVVVEVFDEDSPVSSPSFSLLKLFC